MPKRLGILFVAMLVTASCSGHADRREAHPGLAGLAGLLARTAPEAIAPLHVVAEVINPSSSDAIIRFRITNISREKLVIDKAELPWTNPWSVSVTGITVSGDALPIAPQGGSQLGGPPDPVAIDGGATLVGEQTLEHLYPLARNPRNEDVLLIWSYRFDKHYYTGLALLPKL